MENSQRNSIIVNTIDNRDSTQSVRILCELNTNETFNLEEIYSKFHLIPLETTEECLLREIDKVIFFEKIFILDNTKTALYCYNADGKFLFKIDRRGKSINEYYEISDFTINREDSLLIIMDLNTQKLLEFDLNGNFVQANEIKNNLPSIKVAHFSDNTYLVARYNAYKEGVTTRNCVHLIDDNGNVISENISYSPEWDNYLMSTFGLGYYRDNIIFPNFTDASIYEFNKKESISYPKYTLDFGSKSINTDILKKLKAKSLERNTNSASARINKTISQINELGYVVGPTEAYETEDYLYFKALYKGKEVFGFYCKSNGKVIFNENYEVKNNIPELFGSNIVSTFADKYFIGVFYPSDFTIRLDRARKELGEIEFASILENDETLKTLISKIEINDNPLLIVLNPLIK